MAVLSSPPFLPKRTSRLWLYAGVGGAIGVVVGIFFLYRLLFLARTPTLRPRQDVSASPEVMPPTPQARTNQENTALTPPSLPKQRDPKNGNKHGPLRVTNNPSRTKIDHEAPQQIPRVDSSAKSALGPSRPPSSAESALGPSRPPSSAESALGPSRPPSSAKDALGPSRPPSSAEKALHGP